MKYLELFLCGLWGIFLLSGTVDANTDEDHTLLSDSSLHEANTKFKCPSPFGAFPDPADCAYYYVCIAGGAVHKRCRGFTNFDIWRRTCVSVFIAVCGNDKNKGSTTTPASTTPRITTVRDNFACPSISGAYPDPKDCSKYYNCIFFIPSQKTCPEKQLFDAIKKKCQSEKDVHCGDRQRPGVTTSITQSTIAEITTESITTPTTIEITTENIITSTATESTTTEEITTITTEEITTKSTGPPEHDCDEDDVDCIITETGDANDWFTCTRDVGVYPHPSSDKLFIFCMNWIPSVKKCGLDRYFSKELSTCVEINQFL